jgi:hypothetical protein
VVKEEMDVAERPSDNYGQVTFTFGSKLHGQWGPRLKRSVRSGWTELPWHSSGLSGVLLPYSAF